MTRLVTTEHGASYRYAGDKDEAAREYARFQGCLLQLTDEASEIGNLEGRWVIFREIGEAQVEEAQPPGTQGEA